MSEEKDSGEIGLRVYTQFLSQSPGCLCNLSLLILAVAPFVLAAYLRFFIAHWTSAPFAQQARSHNKVQFTVVSLSSIGIAGFTAFLIGAVFVHLSNSLHNSMLQRVTRAPMRFFNSNPLGRIINRFSKDTAMADSVITFQVIYWLQVS